MVWIHLGTNLVKSCYSTVGILQQTPFPKAAYYTHMKSNIKSCEIDVQCVYKGEYTLLDIQLLLNI